MSAPGARRLASAVCAACAVVALAAGCGAGGVDARYSPREDGCPVKLYPGRPTIPVDELGTVQVPCAPGAPCERALENAVCQRGGDVVWGTADNALNAATLVGHAAHSHRVTQGPRERGCALQIYTDAAPVRLENIGAVTVLCNEQDSKEVCTRALADEACVLGADVLWQVDGPTPEDTQNGSKLRMHGRAAHTK